MWGKLCPSVTGGYLRRCVGRMRCVNTIHKRRVASTQITASSAPGASTHKHTDTGTYGQTYVQTDDEDVDSWVLV